MANVPPFRYPTQSLDDVELIEEVPIRQLGMTEPQAAYGTPHPKSADHRLVWQEPVAGRDGTLTIRRVYRKLPGEPLVGGVVRDATWGAQATVTTQEVPVGTLPDTGVNVLESVVEAKDAQVARKKTTAVEWPTLVSQRLNARGDLETVVESRVSPDTELPSVGVNTTELRLEAETSQRSRLKVAEVESHSVLEERSLGDVGLIPARLRALEVYRTTESVVVPGTVLDTPGVDGVVASKVVDQSAYRSLKRTIAREEGDELPSVTDYKLGNDGELLETTEALVPEGTGPDGGFGVISDVIKGTGTGVAVRTTTRLKPGENYPTLTGYQIDAETQTPVEVTRQVVPPSTEPAEDDPLILDQKIQPIDRWKSLHIVTRLKSLPDPYTEYRYANFHFPGLFYHYSPTAGGAVFYRSAVNRVTRISVEVSFGTGRVDIGVMEIRPVTWSYPNGFHCANVLTNGETFSYTVASTPLILTVPESVPTRSEYEALIGTEAVIGGSSARWKGGIWRTEVWKVILR